MRFDLSRSTSLESLCPFDEKDAKDRDGILVSKYLELLGVDYICVI